jgi:hypothetical protein
MIYQTEDERKDVSNQLVYKDYMNYLTNQSRDMLYKKCGGCN